MILEALHELFHAAQSLPGDPAAVTLHLSREHFDGLLASSAYGQELRRGQATGPKFDVVGDGSAVVYVQFWGGVVRVQSVAIKLAREPFGYDLV